MATGRDAADVAITTSFGRANLTHFYVETFEIDAEGRPVPNSIPPQQRRSRSLQKLLKARVTSLAPSILLHSRNVFTLHLNPTALSRVISTGAQRSGEIPAFALALAFLSVIRGENPFLRL